MQWVALNRVFTAQWEGMARDRGCRVGEVWAGTTSPMPDHKSLRVLSYGNCRRSTHSILSEFQKFSTLRVRCLMGPKTYKRWWGMCPQHPGLDDQYILVLNQLMVGCLHVSDTQWLRLLVKMSIDNTQFWQVGMIFTSLIQSSYVSV